MIDVLDPRTTLARPDLAEEALEGLAPARAYRPVRAMQCVAPLAPLRKAPEARAAQLDQLVFGEAFDVLEEKAGWAWGRARRDGYVGHVELASLAAPVLAPTHRISALAAPMLTAPDADAATGEIFALNALVTVEARQDGYVRAARAGWFREDHLAALDAFERDAAAVAERFVGSPYQTGGRDSRGLDSPALVQQALYACGRACPRATDMQAAELGRPVDAAALARGDLVFWGDHVAMMLDAGRLVHADAHHSKVAVEQLAQAAARAGEPTAYRRP